MRGKPSKSPDKRRFKGGRAAVEARPKGAVPEEREPKRAREVKAIMGQSGKRRK